MATTRRRPLHTCGLAMFAIAQSICRRTLEIDGPIGSLARWLFKWGSVMRPLIRAMQYHWLALLSSIDDSALVMATMINLLFPSSVHMFNKVDTTFSAVEKLPGKFDHLMSRIPEMLHRAPLLEWAVMRVIDWFNLLIVVSTMGALKNASKKEIRVVAGPDAENEDSATSSASSMLQSVERWDSMTSSASSMAQVVERLDLSPAVVLDKSVNDEDQIRATRRKRRERVVSLGYGGGEEERRKEEMLCKEEDPILQLFEAGWQAPKGKRIYIGL